MIVAILISFVVGAVVGVIAGVNNPTKAAALKKYASAAQDALVKKVK